MLPSTVNDFNIGNLRMVVMIWRFEYKKRILKSDVSRKSERSREITNIKTLRNGAELRTKRNYSVRFSIPIPIPTYIIILYDVPGMYLRMQVRVYYWYIGI